jgi:acetyl-CoA carboxylase carboxyl transferase subunit alpha
MKLKEKELKLTELTNQLESLCNEDNPNQEVINKLRDEIKDYKEKCYSDLSSYDHVYLARKQTRPNVGAYIDNLIDEFIELHGDRYYKDDGAIVGGIGYFEERPVTVIGHCKGKNVEENLKCNFGMASPEGFRKAYRLMKQAEKFNRPIITFIDTPGAYPGLESEENGIGEAIASNLMMMSDLKVPIIVFVIGEGGSGGALAISIGDRIVMLENSVYSVLSPEGFSSILWKDKEGKRVEEAASLMKMTSKDLLEDSIIDAIIKEPLGGIEYD